MSDLIHTAAIIADDRKFNLSVRNKAIEIVSILGIRDITDDEKQYVLESLWANHAAVELLRHDLTRERNKSFITKLKDLFR